MSSELTGTAYAAAAEQVSNCATSINRSFKKTLVYCLLNYSSVLQVQTRVFSKGHKKGPTSVEPYRPPGGVVKRLCD